MQIQDHDSVAGKKPNERFLVKAEKPSEDAILGALGGAKPLWLEFHAYIQEQYDFSQETIFFAKNYGWAVRYRKASRTMFYAFPECESFSMLIVLGKDEAQRVDAQKQLLNPSVREVFDQTEQLHDGKWLWVRVTEASDLSSVQQLLCAKRKPRCEN